MATLANQEIRNFLKYYGISQWQLAERLGYTEWHFSRLMRNPFDEKTNLRILGTIIKMSEENKEREENKGNAK